VNSLLEQPESENEPDIFQLLEKDEEADLARAELEAKLKALRQRRVSIRMKSIKRRNPRRILVQARNVVLVGNASQRPKEELVVPV